MAATFSTLSGIASITNNTTLAGATNDLTGAVGDWFIVLLAASNSGASGAQNVTTCVDSGGVNVYTKQATINFTPGSVADDGTTLVIWTCPVTSAITNGNITITFGGNTPEKVAAVYRMQPGAGETISFIVCDATGSTGNATSYSAPTVSVTSGDTIIGAAAIETDDAISGDLDSTNGTWASIASFTFTADAGADAVCQKIVSQLKTPNATGNQSWAATSSTGRDSARTYLIMRSEVVAAAGHPTNKRFGGVPFSQGMGNVF